MKTYRMLFIITIIFYSTSVMAEKKIMLFGGSNNDVYLGCFNCSDLASDSIHNSIGIYGSEVSSTSIFNDISQYGSEISQFSPCNILASNPPALVDDEGNLYGYLTLNELKPKALTDPDILAWLKHEVCKI